MRTNGVLDGAEWIAKATRYRYTLPILAELQRDQGCKFVTLVRRLQASDRAIRQALDYLVSIGWVERNLGYGHPSRPEYLVSTVGEYGATACLELWDELVKWDQSEVALERWPLLVMFQIGGGHLRYGELMRLLAGLSPRALSLALNRLTTAGLVNRNILSGKPPVTEYRLTPWGQSLCASSQVPT